ncbi:MAG TPA: hypothetical protein VF007_12995 [Stellaceae bacterium]
MAKSSTAVTLDFIAQQNQRVIDELREFRAEMREFRNEMRDHREQMTSFREEMRLQTTIILRLDSRDSRQPSAMRNCAIK